MGQVADDWGTPIGSDPEGVPKEVAPKKKNRQDSLTGLVNYFSDNLPQQGGMVFNTPVNGQALATAFKKLIAAGTTPEQIREMIAVFISELSAKPLPAGLAPWRAFLAKVDELSQRSLRKTGHSTYDDISVDKRFSV